MTALLVGCGWASVLPPAQIADGDWIRFSVDYENRSRDPYSLVHVETALSGPGGGARIEGCTSGTLDYVLKAPFVLYLFNGGLDVGTDRLIAAGPSAVVADARATALLTSAAVPAEIAAGGHHILAIAATGGATTFSGAEVSIGTGEPC